MKNTPGFISMLREQCLHWPCLTAQDLTKALYQSQFGCGHFISDPAMALARLKDEYVQASHYRSPLPVEPLGEAFCRVHLSRMKECGLSPETLAALFVISAETSAGDMADFTDQLSQMELLIRAGELPIDREQATAFLSEYRAAGCPATHHSDAFSTAYAPAYRVIRSDFAKYLPLFSAVDRMLREKERIIIAIEGGSASGKSTLGELLKKVYSCTLIHMDDFFLQKHQRTPERFSQPGGNIDHERFSSEIISPLLKGEPFTYRLFDCSCMALGESVSVVPGAITVVEGAYSMHPQLEHAYDLSVFLDISPEEQAERILRRNGEAMQKRFLTEWIPLEARYFEATNARARCTMVL